VFSLSQDRNPYRLSQEVKANITRRIDVNSGPLRDEWKDLRKAGKMGKEKNGQRMGG
jgi:hypothetical protein